MAIVVNRAGITGTDIKPDSAEWKDWFTSQPEGTKIQFEWVNDSCKPEKFTAYRRKRYWEAQKRVSGKLRNTTIKPEDVTYEALRQMGLKLTAYNWAEKFELEKSDKTEEYQTSGEVSSQAQNEIFELRAENEALKGRISYLLDERGLIQAKANSDAKVRIKQLEEQVAKLDNANWEMNKDYTTVDDLAQRRLKQLHELQSHLDSLRQSLKSAKQFKLHGRQVIRVEDFEKFLSGSSPQ